eukprot:ANDGO_07736.mRNA.1 hypothetical protein
MVEKWAGMFRDDASLMMQGVWIFSILAGIHSVVWMGGKSVSQLVRMRGGKLAYQGGACLCLLLGGGLFMLSFLGSSPAQMAVHMAMWTDLAKSRGPVKSVLWLPECCLFVSLALWLGVERIRFGYSVFRLLSLLVVFFLRVMGFAPALPVGFVLLSAIPPLVLVCAACTTRFGTPPFALAVPFSRLLPTLFSILGVFSALVLPLAPVFLVGFLAIPILYPPVARQPSRPASTPSIRPGSTSTSLGLAVCFLLCACLSFFLVVSAFARLRLAAPDTWLKRITTDLFPPLSSSSSSSLSASWISILSGIVTSSVYFVMDAAVMSPPHARFRLGVGLLWSVLSVSLTPAVAFPLYAAFREMRLARWSRFHSSPQQPQPAPYHFETVRNPTKSKHL